MKIVVRSIGPLRQVLGGAQMEVFLDEGATVKTLLRRLAEERGADFARYLDWLCETERSADSAGRPPKAYAPLRILVRGRDVFPSDCDRIQLSEGDEVLVFTPLAGG